MSLDDLFSSLNIGSIERAISNNLYGINHRAIPTAVPSNKDRYGLTFFVRPQLNMTQDNIRNVRLFYPLLTSNPTSIQRYVRCMLDPRMISGVKMGSTYYSPTNCSLIDNNNAFIPILSNNIISVSGWPDLIVPTYTSEPGMHKEVYSQADGIVRNYESYDLDVSFRNTKGDPIIMLFYIWCHYQSNVFEGKLMPYLDFLIENEIDYNTRIYRIVTDSTNTYVSKIFCTGAAFPISVNISSFADFNNERPYNDQSKEITVRFRCMGFEALDDVIIDEFNNTTSIFNSNLEDGKRDSSMVKIPANLLPMFNNRGYPHINIDTYELEWYIDPNTFNSYTNKFLSNNFVGSEAEVGD